jgi:hypothetical protein
MSVCSWGRIPERLIGDGRRGMTVERGVGRSLGTTSIRCAGRGGGGRIVEERDVRS